MIVRKFVYAAGLVLTFAIPAVAQNAGSGNAGNNPSSSGGQQQASSSQANMVTRQRVQRDLEQAGFTQVQVMPQSFLVRAHDKQNRPVLMVIDQDSIMTVTGLNPSGGSGGGQGSSSGSGGSSGSGSSGSSSSGSGSSSR